MVKVALIHHIYGFHKNGANTVINTLLNAKSLFLEKGIDIYDLRPNGACRDPKNKSIPTGIKTIHNLLVDNVNHFLTSCAQYSRFAAMAIMYTREHHLAKKTLRKFFSQKESNFDVLFFHSFFTCYHYLKERSTKEPIVLVLHSNGDTFKMSRIYYKALEKSIYYKRILKKEKKVLNIVDRIVFVSEASRTNFLNLHPYISPDKVFCVYNGIEVTSPMLELKEREYCEVVCVASITVRKGQHYIIDALSTIDNLDDLKVHFTFVGDGPDRKRLEDMVSSKQLDKYCSFVGVTNEVVKYLENSDIYILPSEDEGLPMAIIEAMRSGLPIVSTPVGGIPEMIEDGYNGLLIQPSIEGVKDFLNKINSTDWKTMGNNARKVFEDKFTVKKMVNDYAKILTFSHSPQLD